MTESVRLGNQTKAGIFLVFILAQVFFVPMPIYAAPTCAKIFSQSNGGASVDLYKMLYRVYGTSVLLAKFYDGKFAQKLRLELETLGPSYIELASDPGIALHLDEFLSYIKERGVPQNPWVAREDFKQALGNETLYRALALTEPQLQKVIQMGVSPQNMPDIPFTKIKNEDDFSTYIDDLFIKGNPGDGDRFKSEHWQSLHLDELRRNGLSNMLRRRVVENGDDFLSQSFTSYPEIAVAVADGIAKKLNKKGVPAKVYLLTLSIPKLDLVYFKNDIIDYPTIIGKEIGKGYYDIAIQTSKYGSLPIGQQEMKRIVFRKTMDESVEKFLILNLPPEAVQKIQIVETAFQDDIKITVGILPKGRSSIFYDDKWLSPRIRINNL